MIVGVVAPEFPPERGGMQRYAHEVVTELARRGHRVMVLTRAGHSSQPPVEGVQIVPSLTGGWYRDRPTIQTYARRFDIWHVMNAAWSWVALALAEPLVLSTYGNDFLSPNPVAGFDLAGRLGLPWGSRLDYSLARWRTPRLMKKGLRRVHRILAISHFTEAAFLRSFPFCEGKTTVVLPGLSDDLFAVDRHPVDTRCISLLSVCRLTDPRKSIDVVLHALARLRSRFAFAYAIVGDGPLRAPLEQLARDLGLGDRVRFLGDIDDVTLSRCYASADLFVLAATASTKSVEGFGIVYLEAAACGTPVLAARTGGVEDAVLDGVSGMLIDEVSVETVTGALTRFLSGDVLFDRERCCAFARSFTWSRTANGIIAAYEAALDSSGAAL